MKRNISLDTAFLMMDMTLFTLCNFTDIPAEELVEITRKLFVEFCEREGIERVEE